MKVLVTAESLHGATAEIARAIADRLLSRGLEVDFAPPHEVTSVESYDAVVLGSAIYMGHWLAPATEFVEREQVPLRQRPVWLFSSGPIGDPPMPPPEQTARNLEGIREATNAIDHRVFPGDLDRSNLGVAERVAAVIVRSPQGDYRPWHEIDAWAEIIADKLVGARV